MFMIFDFLRMKFQDVSMTIFAARLEGAPQLVNPSLHVPEQFDAIAVQFRDDHDR